VEVCQRGQAGTRPVLALREGHVPQGPAAEHSASSKDLEAIQKRALAEGLPYQTLISSLLHKYASGRLKEV
jgi:hypothetical protein